MVRKTLNSMLVRRTVNPIVQKTLKSAYSTPTKPRCGAAGTRRAACARVLLRLVGSATTVLALHALESCSSVELRMGLLLRALHALEPCCSSGSNGSPLYDARHALETRSSVELILGSATIPARYALESYSFVESERRYTTRPARARVVLLC